MRSTYCITMLVGLLVLLGGCYVKPEGVVGKVNGVEITEEQYLSKVRQEYESYKLQHDQSPTGDTLQEIYDAAWDNIVLGIVYESLYREYDIYTSREEVMDSLRNNPPAFIRESDIFQSETGFDFQSYLTSLETGEPVNLNWLKMRYFNSYIPFRKLQAKVLANTPVEEEEIEKEYRIRNGSADVEIVHFKPDDFSRQVVSQPEIASYYEAHRDSFLIAESCTLDYVFFPLVPSKEDTLDAKVLVDSLYKELQGGNPFSSLASLFSDAESSLKNGDIGFIEIDKLPSNIRKQLRKGDYAMFTKPFFQDGCWKIYNPVAKTKTMVKLEEIAIVPRVSSRTRKQLYNKVSDFRELALQIRLDRAASEYSMKCNRLRDLSFENNFAEPFGSLTPMIQQAIQSTGGDIFPPQYNKRMEGYVLFQVIESNGRKNRPLVEVSDDIFDILLKRKQCATAAEKAEEFLGKYNEKELLAHAALDGYSRIPIEHFTFLTEVDGIWIEELNRSILSAESPGLIKRVTHTDHGSFIGVINSIQPPPPYGYQSQKPFLEEDIVSRKKDTYFQQWLDEKINEAEIHDWHLDYLNMQE